MAAVTCGVILPKKFDNDSLMIVAGSECGHEFCWECLGDNFCGYDSEMTDYERSRDHGYECPECERWICNDEETAKD